MNYRPRETGYTLFSPNMMLQHELAQAKLALAEGQAAGGAIPEVASTTPAVAQTPAPVTVIQQCAPQAPPTYWWAWGLVGAATVVGSLFSTMGLGGRLVTAAAGGRLLYNAVGDGLEAKDLAARIPTHESGRCPPRDAMIRRPPRR